MRKRTDRARLASAKMTVLAALVAASVLVAALFTGAGNAGTAAQQQRAAVGGYIYAGSAANTRVARAAGTADAKSAVSVPKGKTIGVIQLSGTSSQSIGVLATARQIAKLFGWKVSVCDPNFDPQKVAQCATSIVAQNPAVVFSVSTNTGAMGSGYTDAVKRGIPWISVVSGVAPAAGLRDYGTNGFALAKIIDTYLFKQMRATSTGRPLKMFAIGAPTVGVASANSSKQLERDVAAAGDVDLINHDLDLSNAVQDTLSTSSQALQQNPNLAGMWTLCDFCLPLMAQEVKKAQGSSRKTVVAGLYANPQAIAGVRDGTIDAVSDCPWLSSVWVGIDQVLQNLTRKAPIASSATVYKKYKLKFMRPYVINKSNVGNFGAVIPVYGPDYQTYFLTKWKKEFRLK
jgi:ABC-type sugar transport system substrate-binding protein